MNVIVRDTAPYSSDRSDRTSLDCFECGRSVDDVVVAVGAAEDDLDPTWHLAEVCLPCLKRAVAEAEAAVARDKG